MRPGSRPQITADNYFAFPGSVVDTSSELGVISRMSWRLRRPHS